MPDPIIIDIPHKLGRNKARERIAGDLGKLASFIPGGLVTEHRWEGDTLNFVVEAIGQRIAAKLDVLDDRVHALIDLPPALALFANKLRGHLTETGQKLLK
jgi:Putative polyhydroxyalkanoic acid system protein (PHA_gran_rgn)